MVKVRLLVFATIGSLIGYAVWLIGGAVIVATTPVRYWIAASALMLAAMTACAFSLAFRYRNTAAAPVFWGAPMLPTIASLYLLIVFLTA